MVLLTDVTLTPELERIVQDQVASGKYATATDVIGDGLRLRAEKDRLTQARVEDLRREIAVGIEQLARGEYTSYDEGCLADLVERVQATGRAMLAAQQAQLSVQ
jgi:antitoxin ParD1/3/4